MVEIILKQHIRVEYDLPPAYEEAIKNNSSNNDSDHSNHNHQRNTTSEALVLSSPSSSLIPTIRPIVMYCFQQRLFDVHITAHDASTPVYFFSLYKSPTLQWQGGLLSGDSHYGIRLSTFFKQPGTSYVRSLHLEHRQGISIVLCTPGFFNTQKYQLTTAKAIYSLKLKEKGRCLKLVEKRTRRTLATLVSGHHIRHREEQLGVLTVFPEAFAIVDYVVHALCIVQELIKEFG